MDDTLITRVHALPPEIFNQIYDHVLVCDVDIPEPQAPKSVRFNGAFKKPARNAVEIDSTFKYPVQLHINRHYRRLFANQIFANAAIEFTSVDLFQKFCYSLDISFVKLVERIQVVYRYKGIDQDTKAVLDVTQYMEENGVPFLMFDSKRVVRRSVGFISCVRVDADSLYGWT